MSTNGHVYISSVSQRIDRTECVRAVAGIAKSIVVSSIIQESDVSAPESDLYILNPSPSLEALKLWRACNSAGPAPLDATIALVGGNQNTYMLDFRDDEWEERQNRLRHSIPESIAGAFVPSGLGCVIGDHVLEDVVSGPEIELIATPTASLTLFGHGSPNDWAGYREAIRNVPLIKHLQESLRPVIGATQVWCLWE